MSTETNYEVKETPLCEEHERLGGKLVEFAGWRLPVTFRGLKEEHHVVREKVGLFDVSHMGEFRVKGAKALDSLQWMLTNDVSQLDAGQAQYTLIPNESGGLVDDLIIYCLEKNMDYLLCVNAANLQKDWDWLNAHNQGVEFFNESEHWAQIAVQGPHAMELAQRVFGESVQDLPSFHIGAFSAVGAEHLVARTGYTGEDGVEVFVPREAAVALWKELLRCGEDLGVEPIGLGARDTLRTEARLPLYGHEIDDSTNPYAARLGWVVKHQAKDFVGKEAILAQKEAGLSEKLAGIKMVGRGIPRQGYKVFSFDNEEIGRVTSGTPSPSTGENIGIVYLLKPYTELGTKVLVQIRQRQVEAEVVPTPFYKRPKE